LPTWPLNEKMGGQNRNKPSASIIQLHEKKRCAICCVFSSMPLFKGGKRLSGSSVGKLRFRLPLSLYGFSNMLLNGKPANTDPTPTFLLNTCPDLPPPPFSAYNSYRLQTWWSQLLFPSKALGQVAPEVVLLEKFLS
jgi:hypothetical protein